MAKTRVLHTTNIKLQDWNSYVSRSRWKLRLLIFEPGQIQHNLNHVTNLLSIVNINTSEKCISLFLRFCNKWKKGSWYYDKEYIHQKNGISKNLKDKDPNILIYITVLFLFFSLQIFTYVRVNKNKIKYWWKL